MASLRWQSPDDKPRGCWKAFIHAITLIHVIIIIIIIIHAIMGYEKSRAMF